MPGDELVEHVGLIRGPAVEFDDPAAADQQGGLRIARARERGQAEFVVLERESVEVHRLAVHEAHTSDGLAVHASPMLVRATLTVDC